MCTDRWMDIYKILLSHKNMKSCLLQQNGWTFSPKWMDFPSMLSEISQHSSVQSLSRVKIFVTPWLHYPWWPGIPVHQQLPELSQTHIHRINDAIQPSHPLSSLSPPAFNLSQHQGLFQWVSSSIRWPKYWSFSFNISPSNEYSGLNSFRIHWLDLLAVQETLKSLLQYHRSKASILRCSAFFIVQLSHSYTTTGKTIAFTR